MRPYTIPLAGHMHSCPSCWINFFNQELAMGPRDINGDITPRFINQQISKYHGRYVADERTWGLLEFESEQALMFFELKFA